MDVKLLYTIVAVADHGSFAAAGQAVGLSLSGVSVQMRSLEDTVGRKLFDRSRRPPILTEEGRDFVEGARELIARWEQLSERSKRGADGGVLKIGAVHTVVSGLLPDALVMLRQSMPDLSVRLETGLTHELEAAVRAGTLDAAIVTEPEGPTPNLEFTAFCEEPLVVIAHSSAIGADFREILENNPYVRFNRMARVAGMIDAKLHDLGISVKSSMEIDTLEGVISLVSAGLGVSIVPGRGPRNRFPETIRALPFGSPALSRRLGVLIATDNARRHFSGYLQEALKRVAAGEPHDS